MLGSSPVTDVFIPALHAVSLKQSATSYMICKTCHLYSGVAAGMSLLLSPRYSQACGYWCSKVTT